MSFQWLLQVFSALDGAGVRYLVVGGVAVNAHGYQRLTHDLDLVLGAEADNVSRALVALAAMGYTPMLPVPMMAFADPETRERWRRERNMEVFSLVTAQDRSVTIDILASAPFSFDVEHARALRAELAPGLAVPFLALDSLIDMKEGTGRPRDTDDAQHLRWIREEARDGGE